jgi:3-oxoacyl-[acyl-carrier-protein] synthase-3
VSLTQSLPGQRVHASEVAARLPVAFAGLGAAVPAGRVTNHDLATRVDTSDEWIVERTGIHERRHIAPGGATSDLAVAAGRRALEDSATAPSEVDLLIVCTCTPDQPLPSTAALVARALGVRGAAMDVTAACSGWVYGLVTASSMLFAGAARTALVIGAEVLSPWLAPDDRTVLPLFGDGGAAAVLRPAGHSGPGLIAWDLGVDGDAADLLRVPAGGSRRPTTAERLRDGEHYLKMEGREVFRRAVRAVEASCLKTLHTAEVDAGDVALFVPHQANARIVDAILPRLGIDAAHTMMNIDRYGNTSAASIPLALCEAAADGRIQDGDLVLLAGFGAGMTWATALLRWGYTGPVPRPVEVLP